MTDHSESLILEILKRIQGDMADIKSDVRELKVRVGLVEGHLSGVIAAQHHTNERLDRMGDWIERVERRLELADTH